MEYSWGSVHFSQCLGWDASHRFTYLSKKKIVDKTTFGFDFSYREGTLLGDIGRSVCARLLVRLPTLRIYSLDGPFARRCSWFSLITRVLRSLSIVFPLMMSESSWRKDTESSSLTSPFSLWQESNLGDDIVPSEHKSCGSGWFVITLRCASIVQCIKHNVFPSFASCTPQC